MKLGTWNERSLYRAGSLTTLARETVNYSFSLMGILEVR
jgi:hypothetical protein